MKILLLGKNGQVGWELQRSLAVLGRVSALDFDSQDYCRDFANRDGIAQSVRAQAGRQHITVGWVANDPRRIQTWKHAEIKC